MQGDVSAAAGADDRDLGGVVKLLGADAIRPHAGGVDHAVGANLEALAGLPVLHPHAARDAVLLDELVHLDPVGAHRAEALGLLEHGQHEPGIVGLAVVEEIARGGLAIRQGGQQLDDLLAGDHAVALGVPLGRAQLLHAPAAAAPGPPAGGGHDVVHVQADADQQVGARAAEGGHHERKGTHQMRRQADHERALQQSLPDQPEIEVLEVAQPAVDELAGTARRADRVIAALHEGDAVAPAGGVQRHAGAGDPAADDHQVELLGAQRLHRAVAGDHVAVSLTPERSRRPRRARGAAPACPAAPGPGG